MSISNNNLLLRLHKLAHRNRNDENFHTEALAHLLQHLLHYESVTAVNLLTKITDGRLDLTSEDVTLVNIATWVRTLKGYKPDIEIRSSAHLVYIEVKVESGLRDLQLEDYRSLAPNLRMVEIRTKSKNITTLFKYLCR